MGNLLAYSGIVTKLRAMEAKLLKPEDFEEIASYLKSNTKSGDLILTMGAGNINTVCDYLIAQ